MSGTASFDNSVKACKLTFLVFILLTPSAKRRSSLYSFAAQSEAKNIDVVATSKSVFPEGNSLAFFLSSSIGELSLKILF